MPNKNCYILTNTERPLDDQELVKFFMNIYWITFVNRQKVRFFFLADQGGGGYLCLSYWVSGPCVILVDLLSIFGSAGKL